MRFPVIKWYLYLISRCICPWYIAPATSVSPLPAPTSSDSCRSTMIVYFVYCDLCIVRLRMSRILTDLVCLSSRLRYTTSVIDALLRNPKGTVYQYHIAVAVSHQYVILKTSTLLRRDSDAKQLCAILWLY